MPFGMMIYPRTELFEKMDKEDIVKNLLCLCIFILILMVVIFIVEGIFFGEQPPQDHISPLSVT